MKWLKYFVPFFISLVIFLSIGFTPADCVPEPGQDSCDVPIANPEEGINFENCTYKGFPLYGKIKFVEDFPDLKVKLVEHFPDECGEWQIVEDFPDVKVKIVEHFPDIKIKYVEHFPGKP